MLSFDWLITSALVFFYKSQLFSLSCGICNVEFLSFFPYPVEFLIFFSLSCGICHVELHKAEYMSNTCTGEIPLLTIEKLVTFRVLFSE
jgi:hypothetical protein